jgi:hypothetical protein
LRQYENADLSRLAAEIIRLLGPPLEVKDTGLMEPARRLLVVLEDEHDRRETWICNS